MSSVTWSVSSRCRRPRAAYSTLADRTCSVTATSCASCGRTRSAAPSDYSCTRVDATPELLLDSADHTLEQHHCQPFGGGIEESSGMSRQSHCQSHYPGTSGGPRSHTRGSQQDG